MIQIVEQTHEEKMKMYMKLDKKELIAMLMENQRILEEAEQQITYFESWTTVPFNQYTSY